MNAEIIAMIVLAIFQFLLMVVVSLGSFLFKSSISNLKDYMTLSMEHLSEDVKDIKDDRGTEREDSQKNFDEIFGRLREIESQYVKRNDLKE